MLAQVPLSVSLGEDHSVSEEQIQAHEGRHNDGAFEYIRRNILVDKLSLGQEALWYLLDADPEANQPEDDKRMEWFVKHRFLLGCGGKEVVDLHDLEDKYA